MPSVLWANNFFYGKRFLETGEVALKLYMKFLYGDEEKQKSRLSDLK